MDSQQIISTNFKWMKRGISTQEVNEYKILIRLMKSSSNFKFTTCSEKTMMKMEILFSFESIEITWGRENGERREKNVKKPLRSHHRLFPICR